MRASDRAYTTLREEIIAGRLPAGTLLGEVEQAERLGVSRTPLREALSRLTADGLAAQAPGRGTVVSSISLADVDHLFEVRIPLEAQAARLAATRGQHETFAELARTLEQAREQDSPEDYYRLAGQMDAAIDAAVGNTYLNTALKNLRLHLVRVRRLSKDEPHRLMESAREHREICRAIAAGDPEMADAAVRLHLRHSLAYISARRSAAPQQTLSTP